MEVSKMASEKMLHLLVIQVIHSFYEVLLMMAFSKKQYSTQLSTRQGMKIAYKYLPPQ
jgi:hypothetical protein